MGVKYTHTEINWRTINIYVDVITGEILTDTEAKTNYVITKKTKKTYVYRSTGTITYTNECRRNPQLEFFTK